MWKPLATMSCLTLFLTTCAPSGDFCDIARPDVYASKDVAEYLVRNDPKHVKGDLRENKYGEENCAQGSLYYSDT